MLHQRVDYYRMTNQFRRRVIIALIVFFFPTPFRGTIIHATKRISGKLFQIDFSSFLRRDYRSSTRIRVSILRNTLARDDNDGIGHEILVYDDNNFYRRRTPHTIAPYRTRLSYCTELHYPLDERVIYFLL